MRETLPVLVHVFLISMSVTFFFSLSMLLVNPLKMGFVHIGVRH